MTEALLTSAEIASLDRTSAILAQAAAANAYRWIQKNLREGNHAAAKHWQTHSAHRTAEAAKFLAVLIGG